MGLYKHGRMWWLSYQVGKKRVFKNTHQSDRKLAEAWADAYKTDTRRGLVNPFKKYDVTLGEALDRYLEDYLKRKPSYTTGKYAVKRLKDFFGSDFPLAQIKSRIDAYKTHRTSVSKVKASTLNRNLVILKATCNKAVEWDLIQFNPLARYKLEKVNDRKERLLEDWEFEKLMSVARPELADFILFARHTAMRPSELFSLQWAEVDLKRGWVMVRSAKSGEGRPVPLTAAVVQRLSEVSKERRTGYVFTRKGKPWILRNLDRDFREAVKEAEIEYVTPYALRHAWASHGAMRGLDIQARAEIMGHKDLRMQKRYTHFTDGYLKVSTELAAPKVVGNRDKTVTNDVFEDSVSDTHQAETTLEIAKK